MSELLKKLVELVGSHDYGYPLDKFLDVNAGRFYDVPAGQIQEVLAVKGRHRKGVYMTITLTNKAPSGQVFPTQATALVQWGSMGSEVQGIEVDYCQGTVLALAASDVRIVARNDTPVIEDPPNPLSAPAQLGAFIAYMPYPGETKALRTVQLGPIATSGGTATGTIPLFARYMFALSEPDLVAQDQLITYLDSAGVAIASMSPVHNTNLLSHVPIPNNARQVRWTNNGGGGDPAVDNAALVFTLAM